MESNFFQNKVVIVTGSSMGIGKAIAIAFAEVGSKVVLNARKIERLEETTSEMHEAGYDVLPIQADVSKWGECQKLVDETIRRFGRLDILVNNAGIAARGSVDEMAADIFKKVLEVNVLGTIYPSKAALPYLRQTKGQIVCISSIAALSGIPYNSIYSASKKSLTAFTESLRIEEKASGVKVGLLYVGFTKNDPQKIMIEADGRMRYLEDRKGFNKQRPEFVAKQVLRMIKKRSKSKTLSLHGKFLQLFSRFLPRLISFIFIKNLDKIRISSGKNIE